MWLEFPVIYSEMHIFPGMLFYNFCKLYCLLLFFRILTRFLLTVLLILVLSLLYSSIWCSLHTCSFLTFIFKLVPFLLYSSNLLFFSYLYLPYCFIFTCFYVLFSSYLLTYCILHTCFPIIVLFIPVSSALYIHVYIHAFPLQTVSTTPLSQPQTMLYPPCLSEPHQQPTAKLSNPHTCQQPHATENQHQRLLYLRRTEGHSHAEDWRIGPLYALISVVNIRLTLLTLSVSYSLRT